MWQDKLKEIIYILENSNVNEIEVNFWGRKYRVSKGSSMTATPVAAAPVAPVAAPASAPVVSASGKANR